MKLTWYFDFISPFAYLQLCQFDRLPNGVEVEFKPVLLAGLLNHWQNVGPAEIAPKRIFTYQHSYWLAKHHKIEFKMPPAHPFNPLMALRLAIALGCEKEPIQTIFETIWRYGLDINSKEAISHLENQLQIENILALCQAQEVKDQLRANTEAAILDQVFGVPTFVTQDNKKQIFWGFDAFDMLLDYINDPIAFNDQEMQRIEKLPIGIRRN